VVHDEQAPPPDTPDDNPYIIPRYTQQFLRAHYGNKSCEQVLSLDSSLPSSKPGLTTAKKQSEETLHEPLPLSGPSSEISQRSPASNQKRTTFFEEVEVIEYHRKDKVISQRCTSVQPLHDMDVDTQSLQDKLGKGEALQDKDAEVQPLHYNNDESVQRTESVALASSQQLTN